GLSESGVAAFMVVFLLAGLFASWPLGRLSDKVDRRIVIVAITFALAGAGAAGALAAQENFVLTFGLAAIFGLCALPLYSLAVAHANDVLEEHSPIATAGGMLIGFGFGAMAAPAAISFLMEQTSPAAFPALIGVIALFCFVWRRRQPSWRRTKHPISHFLGQQLSPMPWTLGRQMRRCLMRSLERLIWQAQMLTRTRLVGVMLGSHRMKM
ncbi:MAG: MFS transporter, partial [Alphaproteobacteria bacterium]